MATIKQLQEKREQLKIQIAGIVYDLKEYIKYPCESVDIENIKYQYDFTIREIKNIDSQIIRLAYLDQTNVVCTFDKMQNELKKHQEKTKFTADQLPKKHFSMFDEPFI